VLLVMLTHVSPSYSSLSVVSTFLSPSFFVPPWHICFACNQQGIWRHLPGLLSAKSSFSGVLHFPSSSKSRISRVRDHSLRYHCLHPEYILLLMCDNVRSIPRPYPQPLNNSIQGLQMNSPTQNACVIGGSGGGCHVTHNSADEVRKYLTLQTV
jgi:hypothetical protein